MDSLHHLLRVRMRKTHFNLLKDIAKEETERTGDYVSVSDIVRSSILNWLQTYESQQKLRNEMIRDLEIN
jgi:Arc/MetJ-type ribon-helix-helix transcriptional regulator